MSVFLHDDQLRYLNGHIQRLGIKLPTDPDAVREQAASETPLRPVVNRFVQADRLKIDETRFDEFKAVAGPTPVTAVLNELDEYVVGFLNIEDRRYKGILSHFLGL